MGGGATRRRPRGSVFAAAHVAAFPDGSIDWESTARFREHLWSHGFGVAEAMDTAQRGMGLSWAQARELISRSARQAAGRGAALACGVGTDQLPGGGSYRLAEITGAYEEQLDHVQSTGAQVILMASRALAATARSAADYLNIYGYLLRQADRPVILHWLGEAFDPQLRGYWGAADFTGAAATVLDLVRQAGGKVDGIKLSVLDAGHEVALRRQLPRRGPAVHRRRLPLPGADPGRPGRAQRRAARRVRRGHGAGRGGAASPRCR